MMDNFSLMLRVELLWRPLEWSSVEMHDPCGGLCALSGSTKGPGNFELKISQVLVDMVLVAKYIEQPNAT